LATEAAKGTLSASAEITTEAKAGAGRASCTTKPASAAKAANPATQAGAAEAAIRPAARPAHIADAEIAAADVAKPADTAPATGAKPARANTGLAEANAFRAAHAAGSFAGLAFSTTEAAEANTTRGATTRTAANAGTTEAAAWITTEIAAPPARITQGATQAAEIAGAARGITCGTAPRIKSKAFGRGAGLPLAVAAIGTAGANTETGAHTQAGTKIALGTRFAGAKAADACAEARAEPGAEASVAAGVT
jgi:hypothetical protein